MTTPSNALPDSTAETRAVTPAATLTTRPLYWSIRRELWEHRSVYIAPVAVVAVFLFGFFINSFNLPHRMRALSALDLAHQHQTLLQPYDFAAGVVMLVAFVVSIYYSLDCLYGERRDRSILFWKSMPVSDLTVVLAKATIPLIVIPLISYALTFLVHLTMLLWSSVVLLASGQSVATLWAHVSLFQTTLMILYHLVTVHTLWYAPIYCWLILVSAWARRAPFLWAVLPPLAIAALEKIIFNTAHFAKFIGYRFGGPQAFVFPSKADMPMHQMMSLDPVKFFSTPGLWLGFVAAAIFLLLAARLRRYRDPV
jgi:ABC-2 type transport system permease protein